MGGGFIYFFMKMDFEVNAARSSGVVGCQIFAHKQKKETLKTSIEKNQNTRTFRWIHYF